MFPLVRELYELIRSHSEDEQQYKAYCQSLRNSVLTGFYTPQPLVSVIHNALHENGIIPHKFLDPSAGIGPFADTFTNTYANDQIVCFENDLLTARVLKTLHPTFEIFNEGFEKIEKPYNDYFDIVASNIPFGNIPVSDPAYIMDKKDSAKRRSLGSLHNYFFVKGLDVLHEGGILAYIASRGVMDSPQNEFVRRYLMENAHLVSAVRLPDNTFTDHAGTQAGSDLIVLQKHSDKTKLSPREELFIQTRKLLTVEDINVNRFFTKTGNGHGMDRIVKTDMKIGTNQYGRPDVEYTYNGSVEQIASTLKRSLHNDILHYADKDLYLRNRIEAPKPKYIPLNVSKPQQETVSSPAVRQLDTFVQQTRPESTANVNLRNRRKTRGKGDATGMIDLFSQPNLRFEDTAASIRPESFDERPFTGERQPYYKAGTLLVDNGQVGYIKELYRTSATFQPLNLSDGQKRKAQAYIQLRDCYEKLFEHESTRFEENKTLRESLNYSYNRFVNRYGDLNKKDNAKLILSDATGRNMLSLEKFIDGQKQLADIFVHPVAFSQNELTHVDTTTDALGASLNKYGKVSLGYMLYLTGKEESEVLNDLKGRIFYNPFENEWQVSEKIFSGNVIEKADRFREYLTTHPNDTWSQETLEALDKVMPRRIEFEELNFNFGERWMPTGIYSEYAKYLFKTDVRVMFRENIDHYNVIVDEKNAIIRDKFAVKSGNTTIDGIELMKHALLNTVPHLTKKEVVNGVETIVADTKAMQLANMHIDNIRNGFGEWLKMQAPEFKTRLTDIYNRKYNAYVRPNFDGSFLTFPNLNLKALGIEEIYKSQKDAVWMLLTNGGGIIDHEAGGGKSLIICLATYEMKRLGFANKPIILALKENVQEIAQTFQTAYPDAKLLVPGENDFTKRKRERLFNEMKNND